MNELAIRFAFLPTCFLHNRNVSLLKFFNSNRIEQSPTRSVTIRTRDNKFGRTRSSSPIVCHKFITRITVSQKRKIADFEISHKLPKKGKGDYSKYR